MKNPFMKFFSNDKNPTEAQQNQGKNKIIIFAGIGVVAGALLFLADSGGNKEQKNVGNFNLVNDD